MNRLHLPYRMVVLIAVFAGITQGLQGQTTNIYGVVTDSVTRQRIPSANVSVLGTARGAASNNLGFFYIRENGSWNI